MTITEWTACWQLLGAKQEKGLLVSYFWETPMAKRCNLNLESVVLTWPSDRGFTNR
eukprot:c41807_g1_i1 orf=61-228(+)